MRLLTAKQIQAETTLSTRTIYRLRDTEKWELGVHYFQISSIKILYHLELIQDWIANAHQLHLHENAIESFLASLPSNDRPQRKHNKKAARTTA